MQSPAACTPGARRDSQLTRTGPRCSGLREETDQILRSAPLRGPDVSLAVESQARKPMGLSAKRSAPGIDIIDTGCSVWHSQSDTPDACSVDSSAVAGEVTLEAVRTVGAGGPGAGAPGGAVKP